MRLRIPDDLRSIMTAAIDAGLPIFVSEYGICDASGNGNIDEAQANAWVQVLDQYNVSYVAWNISNKNETSAIIKSTVEKTNALSWEDLSDSGQWLYQVLTNEKGSDLEAEPVSAQSGSLDTVTKAVTWRSRGLGLSIGSPMVSSFISMI